MSDYEITLVATAVFGALCAAPVAFVLGGLHGIRYAMRLHLRVLHDARGGRISEGPDMSTDAIDRAERADIAASQSSKENP